MINIGLIGYGYWGPNLARNFNANDNLNFTSICDFSSNRLTLAKKVYPSVKMYSNLEEFFKNGLDAVAIATPVSTHFKLAKKALEAGKHVWIEKPLTDNVQDGETLLELADKKNRTIFVDHTFIYTGAVRKIKKLIDDNELGDVMYYDSTRVNLGLFQQDVDVIWDLAAHDLSIMDYFMPFKTTAVSATGADYYGNNIIPKAILTAYMENNRIGHINVSWLSPVKIRQTLIGGTSKMVLYDDNQPDEKVKIYDKSVELTPTIEEIYKMKVQYRVGDMHAPKLDNQEALTLGAEHFVECINTNQEPLTGGKFALNVVKVLVASKKSLNLKGTPIEIN